MARAAEPAPLVFDAPVPAPAKSAPLVWRTPDFSTPGYFYTDEHVRKIANRIVTLEDMLAKQNAEMELVKANAELADERAGLTIPKWVWIGAGLVTGAAIGVGVGYLIWRGDGDANATQTTSPGGLVVAAW